ncbi:hypothetical protein M0P65_02860 [Candidatus Gracilibacteria bacterium]|nr:hypothetical protein [Candidatus Gracilibacteria bacterium]
MSENLETDVVVIGSDGEYYLANHFSNEELSGVGGKHISFFEDLHPIPTGIEITEVVLRGIIKTKVSDIMQ